MTRTIKFNYNSGIFSPGVNSFQPLNIKLLLINQLLVKFSLTKRRIQFLVLVFCFEGMVSFNKVNKLISLRLMSYLTEDGHEQVPGTTE